MDVRKVRLAGVRGFLKVRPIGSDKHREGHGPSPACFALFSCASLQITRNFADSIGTGSYRVLHRIRIDREKWVREISFGLFLFFVAYLFFYLTTHKRPPLTLSFAAGFIVFGFVTNLILRQGKWALLLIFTFLPLYPFVRIQLLRFQVVGQLVMFGLSRWTEVLVLVAMFGRKIGGMRRVLFSAPLLDGLTLVYISLVLVYFVRAAADGKLLMGMWGVKEQILFYLYYFLVRFIPFGKEDMRKYLAISAWIATGIAAFGCIQAQFFGMGFLKTLGYGLEAFSDFGYTYIDPNYQRVLPGGLTFVRAISILQDALSLGAYLMIWLLLLQPFYMFPEERKGRPRKQIQYFILMLALLYTTTRSAWIGTAVGTLALAWRRKRFLVTFSAFFVLGLILLALLVSIPAGRAFLYHSLFSGRESSLVVHMSTYGWQFQKMLDNPLGLGLGMTGRVGIRFAATLTGGFNTECWYLQVGTQLGFPGFCLYIAIVLETMRALLAMGARLVDPFLKDLTHGIFAAYLACAIFGIFLNVWSCHVIPIVIHLLVGIALFHFPRLDEESRDSARDGAAPPPSPPPMGP